MGYQDFGAFFHAATGKWPFPYQERFATGENLPDALHVPTGAGKTAAVVLGWLWRRRFHPDPAVRAATPRRLVYALPMRVLVEQTYAASQAILKALGLSHVEAALLMGGEPSAVAADEWWLHPENEAILIGTQDMLLSRALNRGYGTSRFRWPIDYGLLHNDCLWVFDEVQLMSCGLSTSVQIAGLRAKLGSYGPAHTLWMSATLESCWLETVDHPAPQRILSLDPAEWRKEPLARRMHAPKRLRQAAPVFAGTGKSVLQAYSGDVAAAVAAAHLPGTLTLVVVNTVDRAAQIYAALEGTRHGAEAVLLHSRFRPSERQRQVRALLSVIPAEGRIAISTQVVEAGVDISARTLFTELAPWPSLVQRCGRCNRYGDDDQATVYWLDLPEEKAAAPYAEAELGAAREILRRIGEGGSLAPADIATEPPGTDLTAPHLLRRRDFVDLFDTAPDLSGNDLDVSRFIRDTNDVDVQVFWREWAAGEAPPSEFREAALLELCPVPVYALQQFLKDRHARAWRWDHLGERWLFVEETGVRPGQTLMLESRLGGYLPETGWNAGATDSVASLPLAEQGTQAPEAIGSDPGSRGQWITLQAHTARVVAATEAITTTLNIPPNLRRALVTAARWHDRGKAHPVFQATLTGADPLRAEEIWAKAPRSGRRHRPRHFRHELASALAAIADMPQDTPDRDLVLYLIAAHHGRVRLAIRSLPGEAEHSEGGRMALGVTDGDTLPAVDLGGGVQALAVTLDLSPMELGAGPSGDPSWLARMLALRDRPDLGPLRMGYLESLLRVADIGASKAEGEV